MNVTSTNLIQGYRSTVVPYVASRVAGVPVWGRSSNYVYCAGWWGS